MCVCALADDTGNGASVDNHGADCVACVWGNVQLLDQLYTAADADAKQKVLQVIVTKCSAREQKWITRIVLKDLKIGLKHERMLKYYHPDAMEACVAVSP